MAGKYIFQKEEKPLYFGYKEADQKTIGSLFMKNAQNDDEFLKNAPLVIFTKRCVAFNQGHQPKILQISIICKN